MLNIDIRHNMADVAAKLRGMESRLPSIQALALTRTAQDVKAAEVALMGRVFDRPTPFTLKALFLKAATKTDQRAVVWLKDGYGTKAHYLLPQIAGGARPMKRFEERLRIIGAMRADERAVPAAGARIDSYGNMERGQIIQVLSQLSADVVAGHNSNATNSKRSKAKRAQVQYFLAGYERSTFGSKRYGRGSVRQHLPRGVWLRRQTAWGSAVKPVLLFVRGTNYSKRFDFYGTASATVKERYPVHFAAAIERIRAIDARR